MNIVLGGAAIVCAGLLLFFAFMASDAVRLARLLRVAAPAAAAMVGVALMAVGELPGGVLIVIIAAAWLAFVPRTMHRSAARRRRSMVRTAALEMQLDHETGLLDGMVLAGRHEGRVLGRMSRQALLGVYRELAADTETRQLLEAYLDSRFAVWREGPDADARGGHGGSPGPGAMTKQEAYQVLGLEAGASSAEIRKAHRRLMQCMHADVGGASFLAARINEAKDVLLSDHR